MSLFSKLFPRPSVGEATAGYLETLTGYQPVFHKFGAGIYEAELCRTCIHAIATHTSKLKPCVTGQHVAEYQKLLEYQPNPWMDTAKFLYKLRTIYETEGTAFIIPMYDKYFQRIVGLFPLQPSKAEIREKNGKTYVVFNFVNGHRSALEFSQVGILTKYFYKRDFFGEDNSPLFPTLNLYKTQMQGIEEGIKQGASIRFIGKLAQALKPADIEAERSRWVSSNLKMENNGGIALIDTKYSDVKQISSTPYTISPEQMAEVKTNVFNYFGINQNILQNNFTAQNWSAFYEGNIEPFALQLSLVVTNLLFTAEQKTRTNAVSFTSNRLQYTEASDKLAFVQQMLDRGVISRNEAREVFNLDPIENGNDYIIRGEYYNAADKVEDAPETDPKGEEENDNEGQTV